MNLQVEIVPFSHPEPAQEEEASIEYQLPQRTHGDNHSSEVPKVTSAVYLGSVFTVLVPIYANIDPLSLSLSLSLLYRQIDPDRSL